MTALLDVDESPAVTRVLEVRALGEKSSAALDSEVNLLAYLSPMTHQQIVFARQNVGFGWRITPVAVGDIEFQACLLSRQGELLLPRIEGGILAAVSHPWSGKVEITTDQGKRQLDLYNDRPKAIVIDTGNGAVRDCDPRELVFLCKTFIDAMSDPSLADCRETDGPRQPAPGSDAIPADAMAAHPAVLVLGWVCLRATGERSDLSSDEIVRLAEVEPIAGIFADLDRLDHDEAWRPGLSTKAETPGQAVLQTRRGQIKVRAARDGSLALLCGPDAGIVELEIFGAQRRIDLYRPVARLLRINFDQARDAQRVSPVSVLESEALSRRRDFYAAVLGKIDPGKPVGLYVPRWKGVAASTRNLFSQTLPFPHTADDEPADVTSEDIKFLANTLLASGARHFIVSGGDTFWISAIRRVQNEDPRIRFDLLWHSNYLQMGEPHDWNLLKNWMRAIADGLVTHAAVVKEGLEQIFARFGVDTVFIPNVIKSNPSEIRYNGAHDLAGIWLSGSSSYRKLPFAALLALKTLTGQRLIGAGFDDDSLAMVTEMRIPRAEVWREPLPQEALHRNMRRTGLTFYITLSECSPMLPLESMHLGVPCLVGACSHLFRSNPYLYKSLVVQHPLSAETIARQARHVLAEGQSIIDAFVEYSHIEQRRAAEGLERFLS